MFVCGVGNKGSPDKSACSWRWISAE